ncbi:MAG: hypothetical protein RL562_2859 [Planctomycetota bacterium]|jgi:hypothetical protein
MTASEELQALSERVGAVLFGCSGTCRPYATDASASREVEERIGLFAPGGVARPGVGDVRLEVPGIEPVTTSAQTPEAALALAVVRASEALVALPFDAGEQELLRERRGFTFGLVDASPDRVRVEVLHLARRPFAALTLGSRCRVTGATRDIVLDLTGHEAGKTQIYEVVVAPPFRAQDLEVFPLPRPEPGDRLRFVELAGAWRGVAGG